MTHFQRAHFTKGPATDIHVLSEIREKLAWKLMNCSI
jgi:hypothetical protein